MNINKLMAHVPVTSGVDEANGPTVRVKAAIADDGSIVITIPPEFRAEDLRETKPNKRGETSPFAVIVAELPEPAEVVAKGLDDKGNECGVRLETRTTINFSLFTRILGAA